MRDSPEDRLNPRRSTPGVRRSLDQVLSQVGLEKGACELHGSSGKRVPRAAGGGCFL